MNNQKSYAFFAFAMAALCAVEVKGMYSAPLEEDLDLKSKKVSITLYTYTDANKKQASVVISTDLKSDKVTPKEREKLYKDMKEHICWLKIEKIEKDNVSKAVSDSAKKSNNNDQRQRKEAEAQELKDLAGWYDNTQKTLSIKVKQYAEKYNLVPRWYQTNTALTVGGLLFGLCCLKGWVGSIAPYVGFAAAVTVCLSQGGAIPGEIMSWIKDSFI